MESIGTYLKKQRELRKISLEEIAQDTKIHLKILAALEMNDFSSVPGPVFARSFVRSYAKAIGLDVNEAMLACEHYFKTVLNHDFEKNHKARWITGGRYRLKTWVLFLLFVLGVVCIAYWTS